MLLIRFTLAALFLSISNGVTAASAAPAAKGSHLRLADYRIAATAYRLAIRGARFCSRHHPVTGLLLQHLGEYAPKDQGEARRAFMLHQGPGVLAVVEGSPAAQAGLVAGDVLVAVNGKALPSPLTAAAEPDEKKRRRLMERADEQLERELEIGPATVSVLRDGRSIELQLVPERGCLSRARLARSRQPNAFANGRYAIVTTKMLDFVRTDDELAVALAHELSHNILGHPGELEEKGVPKGILRNFGKNASRVLATEEEADRLGMKLVWAAGYDVSAAAPFWRRLYSKYDPIPTPKLFRTHPTLGARERIINETIAELGAFASETGAKRP